MQLQEKGKMIAERDKNQFNLWWYSNLHRIKILSAGFPMEAPPFPLWPRAVRFYGLLPVNSGLLLIISHRPLCDTVGDAVTSKIS